MRPKREAAKPSVETGAETRMPEARKRRFVEAARVAGAREDEAAFDANRTRIAGTGRASA